MKKTAPLQNSEQRRSILAVSEFTPVRALGGVDRPNKYRSGLLVLREAPGLTAAPLEAQEPTRG